MYPMAQLIADCCLPLGHCGRKLVAGHVASTQNNYMCWGACTLRVRAPSWCMLLAGVLLLWDCQVECQLLSTSYVHDSAQLASVLRDAGNASQTTPTDTVIYLRLLSSEVGPIARLKWHVC